MAENEPSAQKIFHHRDALIRDRLWQMKKAAIDILNLVNTEFDYGQDCDGVCDSCILEKIGDFHCSRIVDVSVMGIPEEP